MSHFLLKYKKEKEKKKKKKKKGGIFWVVADIWLVPSIKEKSEHKLYSARDYIK